MSNNPLWILAHNLAVAGGLRLSILLGGWLEEGEDDADVDVLLQRWRHAIDNIQDLRDLVGLTGSSD